MQNMPTNASVMFILCLSCETGSHVASAILKLTMRMPLDL